MSIYKKKLKLTLAVLIVFSLSLNLLPACSTEKNNSEINAVAKEILGRKLSLNELELVNKVSNENLKLYIINNFLSEQENLVIVRAITAVGVNYDEDLFKKIKAANSGDKLTTYREWVDSFSAIIAENCSLKNYFNDKKTVTDQVLCTIDLVYGLDKPDQKYVQDLVDYLKLVKPNHEEVEKFLIQKIDENQARLILEKALIRNGFQISSEAKEKIVDSIVEQKLSYTVVKKLLEQRTKG